MADRIQFRRDTAANWTSVDPILAQGELGYETDTDKFKIGDGTSLWSALTYFSGGGGGGGITALTGNVTASGTGSVVATIAAGVVTNAKLATDVKVGSLAALTTTDKDSVTDAINEVNNLVTDTLTITPYQAKVTSADTTPAYLQAKLVAGTNVTITLNNPGANETLTIASTGGGGGGASDYSDLTANSGTQTGAIIDFNVEYQIRTFTGVLTLNDFRNVGIGKSVRLELTSQNTTYGSVLAGTVSVTNGTAAITGTSTALSTNFASGDVIRVNSTPAQVRTLSTVTSSTVAAATANFTTTDGAATHQKLTRDTLSIPVTTLGSFVSTGSAQGAAVTITLFDADVNFIDGVVNELLIECVATSRFRVVCTPQV